MLKILSLLLVSLPLYAMDGKIEEELFVSNLKALEDIKKQPELIVDHISPEGFELYGPKGTGEYLDMLGYSYSKKSSHHQKSLHKHADFADYPSFEELTAFLKKQVSKNPKIAKIFSIGKSVDGRDLWVVKISDNVDQDEVEPEFKYISSMHGDEITGRELTQFFIRDLIDGYGKDAKITELVNNTEIYIMPSMNPDGSKRRQRANANGYDLNRNFPDWIRGDRNGSDGRQPETKALMKFQAERNFALSANFHGGAIVVNYPWDSSYTRHPFNAFLKDLSKRYADLNPDMRNSRSFNGGITNGADWYVLRGGMQDWSYIWYDDLQVTIELSNAKWPSYTAIPSFYKDNKDSMLAYLKSVHQGAGFKLANSQKSGTVKILKDAGDKYVPKGEFGFSHGEFYKVLPEGNYSFIIQVKGQSNTKRFSVQVDNKTYPNGNYTSVVF